MKTKLIVSVFALVTYLSTAFITPSTQKVISGTYEGTEEFNYVFTVEVKAKSKQ